MAWQELRIFPKPPKAGTASVSLECPGENRPWNEATACDWIADIMHATHWFLPSSISDCFISSVGELGKSPFVASLMVYGEHPTPFPWASTPQMPTYFEALLHLRRWAFYAYEDACAQRQGLWTYCVKNPENLRLGIKEVFRKQHELLSASIQRHEEEEKLHKDKLYLDAQIERGFHPVVYKY